MAKHKQTTPHQAARREPAAPASARIRVRATQLGYYGEARRRVGDVFEIADARHFSKKWMVRVSEDTPQSRTTSRQALREEHAALVAKATPPKPPTADDEATPTGAAKVLGE
jgi:hypothetical protein